MCVATEQYPGITVSTLLPPRPGEAAALEAADARYSNVPAAPATGAPWRRWCRRAKIVGCSLAEGGGGDRVALRTGCRVWSAALGAKDWMDGGCPACSGDVEGSVMHGLVVTAGGDLYSANIGRPSIVVVFKCGGCLE